MLSLKKNIAQSGRSAKPTRLGFYPFGVMLLRAPVPLGPAEKSHGTLGTLSLIVK